MEKMINKNLIGIISATLTTGCEGMICEDGYEKQGEACVQERDWLWEGYATFDEALSTGKSLFSLEPETFCAGVDASSDYEGCIDSYTQLQSNGDVLSSYFSEKTTLASAYQEEFRITTSDGFEYQGSLPHITFEDENGAFLESKTYLLETGCTDGNDHSYLTSVCYYLPNERHEFNNDTPQLTCYGEGLHALMIGVGSSQCPDTSYRLMVENKESSFSVSTKDETPSFLTPDLILLHTHYAEQLEDLVRLAQAIQEQATQE